MRTGRRPAECARREKAPIYDTDDTASAILRYGRELMATVVTTRSSGSVSEELSLHGESGSINATAESCLLRDRDGNVLERFASAPDPLEPFRRQAEAFARAVLAGADKYECSAWENLLNLATIEAIYLSDSTSQPEHPLRLLKVHGLGIEDCLARRPNMELT